MSAIERTEKLPVSREVDVLVVGGGPAGFSAGFAAARAGAKTLIVEQFSCLGGIATAGGHGHICLYSSWADSTRVVGGHTWEAGVRTAKAGFGVCNNSNADFEVEGLKLVLEQMAAEHGAEYLYYTQFSDALVEDGRVVGAVIQNKTGRSVIRAARVIDATGDGDVAAKAGCGFDFGEEGTGLCQPMTLMFTIGGVDAEKLKDFRKQYGYKAEEVWKRAQEAGDMRPFQSVVMGWWWTPTRPDQIGVNFTHINRVDATKAEDLTYATAEGRRQAYESIEVYRKYVPGMEDCYMVSTPCTVGTRESRRIHGLHTLTRDDVVSARRFDDTIGFGSFFIDIHNVSGPGMDNKTWRPDPGFNYQIPYRIIVPKDVENLLVAGRCASATHEALGSLRVMPQCGVMGDAAGIAAVMSLEANVTPSQIDVPKLQARLRDIGAIVDDADVSVANPPA